MTYKLLTQFWYDEDDGALLDRLQRLFGLDLFRDSVLGPRGTRLPPSRANLAQGLRPDVDQSSDVRFATTGAGKPIRGALSLTRNSFWISSKFTSYLELSFSLSEGYKGGPFHNAGEVRDALLTCTAVGPAPMGFVTAQDGSQELKGAQDKTWRAIDSMAVPASIEWVTALHVEVVDRMAVDLTKAASAVGALAGREGDHWWIILGEEAFSFNKPECVDMYQRIEHELGLRAIHRRFPRQ